MVVIRIVFLSLMVVLPIGCESTQSDLGVAEKLLKKFDEQYGSDCQFLYVQLQNFNLQCICYITFLWGIFLVFIYHLFYVSALMRSW